MTFPIVPDASSTRNAASANLSQDARELWASGTLGKKARRAPRIVFGMVHEDAQVEVAVLRRVRKTVKKPVAFCIGSGGCTALSLLLEQPSQLHIVDINSAQVCLIELKIAALQTLQHNEILRCFLRDARPFYKRLRAQSSTRTQNFWDENRELLKSGLNRCGIIEQLSRAISFALPLTFGAKRVERMFAFQDIQKQRAYYRRSWNKWLWRAAFSMVLSKPILRLLYARGFVSQVPTDFAQQMKGRVDEVFTHFPAATNPYLWQTFRGQMPLRNEALPLCLQRENFDIIRANLNCVTLQHADAATYLEAQAPDSIDFFALSNILEVTTIEYSKQLFRAVHRAATPNAMICLRSIFPPHETETFHDFHLDEKLSHQLESEDRSLFCKNIRVLRVRK